MKTQDVDAEAIGVQLGLIAQHHAAQRLPLAGG